MRGVVPELRHLEWIEGAGHWIQQEYPGRCNRVLLEFLAGLKYG
jgi:pimeloyl-ACP methyl ester carboxylesterase